MALIKCPECGKEYSDTASACPHCGYTKNTQKYGKELGAGIKEGLKGLNTVCSPKKRKTCILLNVIPILGFIIFMYIGMSTANDSISYIGIAFGFCGGIYQFYVGKIKLGIIYTITMGGFVIGAVLDLFKLLFTKTFKDSNGFPLIY
jgi:hypothetical protein